MNPSSVRASIAGLSTLIDDTLVTTKSITGLSRPISIDLLAIKGEVEFTADAVIELKDIIDTAKDGATLSHFIQSTDLEHKIESCKATVIALNIELGVFSRKSAGNPLKKRLYRMLWTRQEAVLMQPREDLQYQTDSIKVINQLWKLKRLDDVRSASTSHAEQLQYLQDEFIKLKSAIGRLMAKTSVARTQEILHADVQSGSQSSASRCSCSDCQHTAGGVHEIHDRLKQWLWWFPTEDEPEINQVQQGQTEC